MGFFSKLLGKTGEKDANSIYAPVSGQCVSISEVPDPAFSGGMLGNGVAILPSEGKVYAPCDATVNMMFTTGHAVSLVADSGAEILIHVGLETVGMDSEYFIAHVRNGQRIMKGDLMIEVDLEGIRATGMSAITPVLVSNSDDFGIFKTAVGKTVTNDDVIIELAR